MWLGSRSRGGGWARRRDGLRVLPQGAVQRAARGRQGGSERGAGPAFRTPAGPSPVPPRAWCSHLCQPRPLWAALGSAAGSEHPEWAVHCPDLQPRAPSVADGVRHASAPEWGVRVVPGPTWPRTPWPGFPSFSPACGLRRAPARGTGGSLLLGLGPRSVPSQVAPKVALSPPFSA